MSTKLYLVQTKEQEHIIEAVSAEQAARVILLETGHEPYRTVKASKKDQKRVSMTLFRQTDMKPKWIDRLILIILLSLCALGAVLALGWH